MKIKRGQLSSRIFIIIVVLILIPFTVMLQYVKIKMETILREEISHKVIQNLSKSENEINQVFNKMVSISNMFYIDPKIAEVFSNDSYAYYERMMTFNDMMNQISMLNLYDDSMDYMKITFFDKEQQAYANWSLNNNNFTYLLEQDWVQESINAKGYIVWSMSSKGYDKKDNLKNINQISLARSIMNNNHSGNVLGTVLISIDQQKLSDILNNYKYSELDSIFATTKEGEILFHNNDILNENIKKIAIEHSNEQNGSTLLTVNGGQYLLSFYTVKLFSMYSRKQLKIFYLNDYQKVESQINDLMVKINILCILFIVVIFLAAFIIAKGIARPIRVLSNQMKNYRVGEAPIALSKERNDEIGEIYSVYYNMSVHINDLFAKLRQEQVTKEKYKYESLRSKMSPHFLFNTLNSIRWMAIIRNADNIRENIDSLAEILKYSLTQDDEMVDLEKELEVIKNYANIQNMRFGNGYSLVMNLAPDLERCQIIKFILQPSVENIFKHAFPPQSCEGVITICGSIKEGSLEISISDNGKGFSEEVIYAFDMKREGKAGEKEDSGIGLGIINERIRVSHGIEFGIGISNNIEGGARVDYYLPVIYPES